MRKKSNLLLTNEKKYGGQYVATRTFKREDVVSSGATPEEVYNDAQSKGVKNPVVFYVPEEGVVHIY